MKSFLLKAFIWASLFLPWNTAKAQPIQLIPKKEVQLSVLPLPPSPHETTGIWEGTPLSIIEAYFPQIPVHLTSAALRALRSKVLNETYAPLPQSASYEKTRLSLLIETGHFEKAREILLETPLPNKESFLLDLQWLTNQKKKACEKIANLMRTAPILEWKTQNIYCLYVSGEEERGKIALELLSESDLKSAALLSALFDPALHPPFYPMIGKSPFLLTVWGETSQDIPEEALKLLSPASLALVAMLESFPFKTRLSAAEKAAAEGLFKPESFVALTQEAPPETLLGKFVSAFKAPTSEALLPLFEAAVHEKNLRFIAEVFQSDLLRIEPSLETLPLAPYLIRAFLSADQKNLAKKWSVFYMREAPDEAIALLPLLHLAFPQIPWGGPQIQAWQAYQMRLNPSTAPENSYSLRRLLNALQIPFGPEINGEPPLPSWRQEKTLFGGDSLDLLEAAVKSHREGEGLLLVLTLIGDTPLQDFSLDKLAHLLEALIHLGYPSKARALALDFLLAKEGGN